jgi:hypothetical protein
MTKGYYYLSSLKSQIRNSSKEFLNYFLIKMFLFILTLYEQKNVYQKDDIKLRKKLVL